MNVGEADVISRNVRALRQAASGAGPTGADGAVALVGARDLNGEYPSPVRTGATSRPVIARDLHGEYPLPRGSLRRLDPFPEYRRWTRFS